MPRELTPLEGFYLYLGQLTASVLWTFLLLALVFVTAYICARLETRREARARKINRKDYQCLKLPFAPA